MTFNMVVASLMMVAIVVLLFKDIMNSGLVLGAVSLLSGLLMGYTFKELNGFIMEGFGYISGAVFLMVFAVLYFGILHDAGVFKLLVRVIMRLIGNNTTAVLAVSYLLSIATQLDGSGATTALCTLPPMKPIFTRMNIHRQALMLMFTLGSASVLFLPWAPGINENMAYIGSDAYTGFRLLIPVMIFCLVLGAIFCFIYSAIEKKNGAGMTAEEFEVMKDSIDKSTEVDTSKKGILIFDIIFTLIIVATMLAGFTTANVAFAIGLAIMMVVNYRTADDRSAYMGRQARAVASMSVTMFGLAVFLGVVRGSGCMNDLANYLIGGLGGDILIHIPFILCLLAVPLQIILGSTVSAVIIPAVAAVTAPLGVDSVSFMAAYFASQVSSVTLCFFSATPYLALELADVKMTDHLKYSLLPCMLFSILTAIFCVLIGLIPF